MFRRMEAALLAGLLLAAAITPCAHFASACGGVRQQVLRLHVLANSDSPTDQQHKLAVRDALLAQSEALFAGAEDFAQAQELAEGNLALLEQTARKTLQSRGCSQPVKAGLVPHGFATRSYGEITLPAGEYLALRVVIGEGKGQNWWCVMYPPLCLPAAAGEIQNAPALQQLNSAPAHRLGFAVVELWQQAKNLLQEMGSGA